MPIYLNQWETPITQMQFDIWYYAGWYAVSIFHDVIALICFGMIHTAGYRWDILRPVPAEQVAVEQNADAIPPVLAPQI